MIIGDDMEKEIFIRYVQMLHRFEKLSKEEFSIYSNTEEVKVITEVRKLVEHNAELMGLLKKIHSLPDNKRMEAVIEFFAKDKANNKITEDISQKYNINQNSVKKQFLSNGKEIVSFYSDDLNKQIILENKNNEFRELDLLTKEEIQERLNMKKKIKLHL